jgi:pSer/pThr/pTyr-binding forkhead associated (FHA) protein
MKGAVVKITRDLSPPKSEGTYYRLLCLTGQSKGVSYYLQNKRVVMGRGETADIRVLDTKTSREHAELKLVGGSYILTDLGSQNGVVVNDLKVVQHQLEDGDKIIIGQTVYKFSLIHVEGGALATREDTSFETDLFTDQTEFKDDKAAAEAKRKKLIYAVVGLVAVLFFFMDTGSDNAKGKKKKTGPSDLEVNEKVTNDLKNKQSFEDKEVKDKIDSIVHRGRREFRERNYFRAIDEFNRALIHAPSNGYIKYLLDRTRQRLDEEIEQSFFKASQCIEARRYGCAKVSLCAIVRYLQEYQDDQRYKDAKKQLEIIEDSMGIEPGELKCI